MAPEAPTYDLILMLDAEAPEDLRRRVLDEVSQAIEQEDSLVGRHDWGVRRTAYEIRHQASADYHLFQFHASPGLLETLNRTLRITDGVIRYRIVKLARGTPPPPEARTPEPRAPERADGQDEPEAAPAAAP